jgi:putative transposase
MPRRPRIDAPGLPQHIVQRGIDRQACFFTDRDRVQYLADLREIALKLGCAIHAYVLMTNHVHLLATPRAAGDVGRMMQALGRRYVRAVNDRYGRTGSLWEGRFKASLVESEGYLLACQRYIERNPVRAALVADPGEYAWSSYRANALGAPDPLLSSHPAYEALARDPAERCDAWRRMVAADGVPGEVDAIRFHLQRQQALGTDRFQQQVGAMLGRRAGPGRPGRPRKAGETVL